MKTYISKGTICVKGKYNLIYSLCTLTYILNIDESFKYVFEPNYAVMDLLDSYYFQGIPGLNLDLHKTQYIREDMTPVFISERVPQKNREDYLELLEKVGLEFMEPIEYLKRTKLQYSGDNLFVIPYSSKKTISYDSYTGNETNNALIKDILQNICFGNDIIINKQLINDDNRKQFHDIFLALYSRSYKTNRQVQQKGIEKAKEMGKYRGRKPIPTDEVKFMDIVSKVDKGEMSPRQGAKLLNISIDKYYRLKHRLGC